MAISRSEIEGRSAHPFGLWVAVGLGFASVCSASCQSRPGPATTHVSIAVPYELASLDPHVQNSVSHFAILSHLYEGLVTMDADMRIRPALARAWESPDPRTWVFHLRADVSFHDGRPLRAADVVYSIETLRAQRTARWGSTFSTFPRWSASTTSPWWALSDIALHERMGGGGSTFWLSRWGCQTGDASDAFENLLHSPDPARGLGLYNWGGFADPEVDRAIEDLAAVEDGAERAAALHRLMARLADDPVVLPLYVDQDAYVLDRSLSWRPRADGLVRAAEIGLRR